MALISVIMPTYNVEEFFPQCIESVINQTLKDIEIIPVDDGSPDACGKIMDDYAAKERELSLFIRKMVDTVMQLIMELVRHRENI